ncbi:MAG: 5-methyltetrahydrofolate--homocysteine methyltransferase [Prevotella sp.]|nr:5-methyltetrahydrofolate--homocysteine methyltransferase [Prevotella sp.]
MLLHYDISDVAPYINWVYFYFAWQLKNQAEQQRMRHEAEQLLASFQGKYRSHAVFTIFDAYSEGDDIVLSGGARIPLLRQQQAGSEYLCLSDFIAPRSAENQSFGYESQIGIFATTVDSGLESDFDADPYAKMMSQLLADRLAEATAERMHEEVRKRYWGYARSEQLSMNELHQEHFQGIRPAVGYPSLPDTSLNFVIDQVIDMKQIGIRLTENGAMRPHASVSGLMLSHPKARYFSVGKIGADQLRDYARRRSVPLEMVRKFLAANL